MIVKLTSTSKITELNGIPARIWEGETESGIKCHAFITRIAIDKDEPRSEEFSKRIAGASTSFRRDKCLSVENDYLITPLFHNFFSAKMMHPQCFCQEQVDRACHPEPVEGRATLDRNALALVRGRKKIMKQLPFTIQITRCSNHYLWYEQAVYEKFLAVAIDEQEQTFVVITYDGYGCECLEEVNISDCKILER